MKVYAFDRSPYCIAIVRVLEAAGVAAEVVEVSPIDRSPVIRLTAGAYYQVPVLQNGGDIVYEQGSDSQDVADYIDQHYLSGRLFPGPLQGLQRILLHYLENDVESVTFKAGDARFLPTVPDLVERTMLLRHKERKFGIGCVKRWQDDFDALVRESIRLLEPFEEMLAASAGSFLFGAVPVYSDFLLSGILENYTYRELNPFPPGLPRLANWAKILRTYRFRPAGERQDQKGAEKV